MVGGRNVDFWQDGVPAGLDDLYAQFDTGDDPGADAFQALARIYSVFGLAPTQIPYTTGSAVDPELIKAIR
jgi:hypothetical protein